MIKIVAYLTLTVVACLTTAFMTKYLPYAFDSLSTYEISAKGLTIRTPKNSTRRLEYLDDLVEMPIVGSFFMEQKVAELMGLNKFNETIKWAKKALLDPWNSRSFSIWYHKAISECVLKDFHEC